MLMAGVIAGAVLGCKEANEPASTAPQQEPNPTQELFNRANVAIEAKQWRDAAKLLKEAIANGPYHEGARYSLGHILLTHHTPDEVVTYYQQTVGSDPKPQTSYYFWAQALAKAGDDEGALDKFRDAIAADPAHELSEVAWGALLERQGNLEEALTHYERAVHIHPELTNALEACARLLDRLERPDEAQAYRERAKTANPNTPMRFAYWARVLLEEGRDQEALAELEKAVQMMPNNEQVRVLRDEVAKRLSAQ